MIKISGLFNQKLNEKDRFDNIAIKGFKVYLEMNVSLLVR